MIFDQDAVGVCQGGRSALVVDVAVDRRLAAVAVDVDDTHVSELAHGDLGLLVEAEGLAVHLDVDVDHDGAGEPKGDEAGDHGEIPIHDQVADL